jgi:hypothetical protein
MAMSKTPYLSEATISKRLCPDKSGSILGSSKVEDPASIGEAKCAIKGAPDDSAITIPLV